MIIVTPLCITYLPLSAEPVKSWLESSATKQIMTLFNQQNTGINHVSFYFIIFAVSIFGDGNVIYAQNKWPEICDSPCILYN